MQNVFFLHKQKSVIFKNKINPDSTSLFDLMFTSGRRIFLQYVCSDVVK